MVSIGSPEIFEAWIEPTKGIVAACPGETRWGSIACLAQFSQTSGLQKPVRNPVRICCPPSAWFKALPSGQINIYSLHLNFFNRKMMSRVKHRVKRSLKWMQPCDHQIMYLAQIVVFFLICIAHLFWLSPLGLVKHLAFTDSNVFMKHEVSRSRGRVSVWCRHSHLPAGSVSGFVFVRICHWRNLPTCCPFTSLPGLSEVWQFLTKWIFLCFDALHIRIEARLWHEADWCSASFCVKVLGNPECTRPKL